MGTLKVNLRHKALISLALLLSVVPAYYLVVPTQADKFTNRSLVLSSSLPGTTATYTLGLTITNPASIGSLQLLFCENSPLEADACTAPAGMDASAAVLASQTGLNDFTLSAASANSLLLSRAASAIIPPQPVTFTFTGIVNPSSIGPYYGRVSTYASSDGTGPSVDFAGLAFAINHSLQISAVVPPYLAFCAAVSITNFDCGQASGNYLNMGNLSTSRASAVASQMVVATNAGNGYTIQAGGNTLTSGNNVIAAMASLDVSRPGTAQFGINLRANSDPAIGADPTGPGVGMPVASYDNPNHFRFVPNDNIVLSPNADDYRKFTVSYMANTSANQPIGVYVSTLTYVCTPNF